MTEEEFVSVLGSRFQDSRFYTQHPHFAPWWSIRTFASDNTAWVRVRGFSRLRRVIQNVLSPEVISNATEAQRKSTVELILRLGQKPRKFLNPYALRPRRKWTREKSHLQRRDRNSLGVGSSQTMPKVSVIIPTTTMHHDRGSGLRACLGRRTRILR